jgi:dihydrofolate reductase
MSEFDPDESTVDVVAVAAVAENGVIGDGDELPWHLPDEKRRYRKRVGDSPIAVGRRTYEMMLDDPAGRTRIVLSRTERTYDDLEEYHAGSPTEAIELAVTMDDVLYVLGGEEIYRLFLPFYDRMLLSRVRGEYEGDSYFPEFDREEWTLATETDYEGYALEEWVRRSDTVRHQ